MTKPKLYEIFPRMMNAQAQYKEYEPIRDEQYPHYHVVEPNPTQFGQPARTNIDCTPTTWWT